MRRGVLVMAGLCMAMGVRLAVAGGGPPPAINVSGSDAFSMTPRLATLPGGGVSVVWREGDVTGAQIFLAVSRDGGVSFNPGRDISDTPGPGYLPALAIDPAGAAFVLWREPLYPSGLIRFTRATDVDAEFSSSRQLSVSPPAFAPDLAAPVPGGLIAVWDQDRQILLARSPDGGDTWTGLFALTPADALAGEARVAADALGRVAVLFLTAPRGQGLAVLRLSTHGGARFRKPKLLSRGYPDVGEPAVALGPRGRVYAAWVNLLGDFPDPDQVVFWNGRGRRGRTIAPGHDPALAIGPDGTVHLVWRDQGGEVFYTRSQDQGRTFSTPVNVSETPGGTAPHDPGFSSHPNVAVDVNGGICVAWQEAITPTNDEIYARRVGG